jgi:hypothetical protein
MRDNWWTTIINGRWLTVLRANWMYILGVVLVLAGIEGSQVHGERPMKLALGKSAHQLYFPVMAKTVVQNGPDVYTTSYYLATVNTDKLYQKGCELGSRDLGLTGTQDNVVILDFGGPRRLSSGAYGARLFTVGTYVSTDQIAAAVQSFGLGYYVCTGSDLASNVVIGIGTNNYTYDGSNIYQITYAHGRAWAQMVNQVNDWFVSKGYSRQVSAVGANDIELTWNDYASTKDWLDGYDSANQYEMINFGALPGCPYLRSPGAQCGSYTYPWTREQAWYVTWGSPPVYPLPEIYANSGVNAEQWYLMSVYAYENHGLAMEFRGVMTQWQACEGSGDSTCEVLDNTPQQGWGQLSDLVNGDARTAHRIRWSTDIEW